MFIEMGLHEYFLSINNKQRQCWLVISSRNQRKRKRKKKKKKMEGDDESLKLLGHWASPYALRVILALKLKGIDNYIYMEENLPEKSSLLLQYNPVYKKIPVLVHNGKPISESLVIMEYIDETWKQRPLLAKDPYERAKARFWAKFADETCAPATFKVFSAAGAEQVEKASEEARSSLKMLETGFEGRPFFGGEEIGFADVAIGWIGVWAGMVGEIVGVKLIDQNEMPLLSAYFARFLQIPKIRDCFPPQSKLLEHNKAFHHHLLTGKLKY